MRIRDQPGEFISYRAPISLSNSLSLKIFTPNSFAFSYFDPGSVPTTT